MYRHIFHEVRVIAPKIINHNARSPILQPQYVPTSVLPNLIYSIEERGGLVLAHFSFKIQRVTTHQPRNSPDQLKSKGIGYPSLSHSGGYGIPVWRACHNYMCISYINHGRLGVRNCKLKHPYCIRRWAVEGRSTCWIIFNFNLGLMFVYVPNGILHL